MTIPSTKVIPAWLPIAALLAAIALAFANSFHGVFVFDDLQSIVTNPTLRSWPTAWRHLPGGGTTASGRPLLNFTLALNFAAGGLAPFGYHLVNLLIHAAAAVVLFTIVRRTLHSTPIAFVAALLWAVHPLQTESVTYVVQRAEALMGLCYLLALAAFIRRQWAVSCLACLCGAAAKEVIVTAPVVIFLYDRLFVSGGFRAAWRAHRSYYLALALCCWLPLAIFIASTGGNRSQSIGFGIAVPWWKYALTECHLIPRYLRLAVWPRPLVFYYDAEWARTAGDVIPGLLLILALLGATVYGLTRGARGAFLGVWFFLILAPTSSIVPGATQTIAEHRLYLPLAAITVLAACALVRLGAKPAILTGCLLAAGLIGLTIERNEVYASELALWTDTVAKTTDNELALHNLANALLQSGRRAEAIGRYREALALRPDDAKAHHNLGYAQLQAGQLTEAVAEFNAAVRLNPDVPDGRLDLGNAYLTADRPDLALPHLEGAARLDPQNPKAHYDLALALYGVNQLSRCEAELREALRLDPNYRPAREALSRLQ